MYLRPKPGETEEDLLRLQEEFERNKTKHKLKPAANFISSNEGKQEVKCENVDNSQASIVEQLANTFEAVPSDIKLQNIEERKAQAGNVPVFKFNAGKGFPQAKRRDPTLSSGKGSIFSQHIKKLKKEEMPMEMCSVPITEFSLTVRENKSNEPSSSTYTDTDNTINKPNLPSESYILTGKDSKQIHEENMNLIKSMTEEEILEERERLMATMDPAILTFLKSRRKQEKIETRNPTIKEQNEAANDIEIEEIQTPTEILMQPSSEKWLNFDIVEANKLAWMKDMDIPKIDKSKQFEARFDFEGWLLPFSEPEISDKNRILYHHGEEPGRPGYTLQELFQLSRSSIIQQKIIALNCIANIVSLYSTGVYDNIIDIPVEQIFFVLRFCLDDNSPAVLNASIKAMRNLICSVIDEMCLDGLLGFGLGLVQPILAVDNEMEDDNTVNDQQLAEKNIIKCLARTDILTRIRYIINTVQPPLETLVYCMDILIRLARDSEYILMKITTCENLLESIIKYFVPREISISSNKTSYGLPLLQSVKLLRILSCRNKLLANKLITKFQILKSLTLILSSDTFSKNINGLRLQTECMHFWSVFVNYGMALEDFSILQPLLQLLDYHFKNTDLDMTTTFVRQGHLAAILILLGHIAEKHFPSIMPFLPMLLERCYPKWTSQFANLTNFSCGKLQIISALLYCLSCIRRYQKIDAIDETLTRLIDSNGFQIITNHIRSGSMLLNNYETHQSSSNLKFLEGAAWHTMDHVVPILQTNSCLPFLFSISRYVNVCNNCEVQLSFLKHKNIQIYLESLQKLEKYYLSNNWFARIESQFLMNVLKSSILIKDHLDASIFYDLSVKCLCVFNSEQKPDVEFLLEKIVFSPKFYPSHVLMKQLDISQRPENFEMSFCNLAEILEVYTQVLGLKQCIPDFSTAACIDIAVGNVIPIDWIYTPILVLYSNQQDNKASMDEGHQIFIIRNCLRWILIYETYFPSLAATINPTDKFCRLACVFLGSDSLFLIKEIHDLLEACFRNLITKSEHKLNFQKDVQGLNNFQDFYTQLLEQYQGVSYGNILFGNVVLIPLAQKHNIQYKKTLWSEYMGAVQIFNVTPEQCMCNLQLFLDPPEEDISLLKCYRKAILNNIVKQHSVLFKIAKHHVENFISKRKNKPD